MSAADQSEMLSIETPALFDQALRQATRLLRHGQVVVLPTETVYGLAANALDPRAVRQIFQIKGRPAHNPIIVHVSSLAMARQCVRDWPEMADALARSFWPGPLTVVLHRSAAIPDEVTGGGQTVGVRWPSHPFMQAVIEACGFPLAAPSANPSSQLSPTRPDHVLKGLGGKIPLVVDGGPSQVGIESTVVDLTVAPPAILRPGMIHAASILAVTGSLGPDAPEASGPLRSPGLLARHYSPKARVRLCSWKDDAELENLAADSGASPANIHVIAHTRIPSAPGLGRVSVIPHDAEAFARAIYSELHLCDEAGARLILIEALPGGVEWAGIADRLQRAMGE